MVPTARLSSPRSISRLHGRGNVPGQLSRRLCGHSGSDEAHHNTYCSYADTIMPQFFLRWGFAFRLTYWPPFQHARTALLPYLRRHPAVSSGWRWWRSSSIPTSTAGISGPGLTGDKFCADAPRIAQAPTWFQTLMHIAVTALWILPVIRRLVLDAPSHT